jgi:hypothetical protein
MADGSSNVTAGSTPPGGNAGAGQSQPGTGGGMNGDSVSIPRSEYDKLSRYGEQVKGFQPFVEKFKNYGIQRPEDFDRLDPYYKSMQELEKRGIKPDALSRIYSQDADDDLSGDGRAGERSSFDPKEFEKTFEAKMERKLAEREHDSLTKKEAEYVDTALKEFFGDEEVDGMSQYAYRRAVNDYLKELRSKADNLYPPGHPLHDYDFKPLNESHAKLAVEHFKAEKAKYAGSAAAAKADAAIRSEKKGVSSSAGRSGGGGAPKNEGKKRSEDKEADEITKNYEAIKARRAAGR